MIRRPALAIAIGLAFVLSSFGITGNFAVTTFKGTSIPATRTTSQRTPGWSLTPGPVRFGVSLYP